MYKYPGKQNIIYPGKQYIIFVDTVHIAMHECMYPAKHYIIYVDTYTYTRMHVSSKAVYHICIYIYIHTYACIQERDISSM